MPFAILNGCTLHYADDGDLGGYPILFSNSLGTDFRIWDDMIAHMGNGWRFLRYDKRGHGLSDAPSQPYRIQEHVDDAIALLDHLGIAKCAMVGLSVGGLITQGVYATRPELLSAVVLSDTAHKIGSEEMWNSRIEAINRGGIPAISDNILERWFSNEYRTSQPDQLSGYRNMLERTPVEGYCGTGAAIRDADYTETARSLALPCLLICGSNDGSTPTALMQETHELIAGSRYEIIDGPGHLPCIEAPEATAGLVADFFRANGIG